MDVAPKKKREGSIEDVNMDFELMNNGHHIECIKKSTTTTATNGTIRDHSTKLTREESSSPDNECESNSEESRHDTSPECQPESESESIEIAVEHLEKEFQANKEENEVVENGEEDDEELWTIESLESTHLAQQYSVVKTLFENLPMRDLLSCACVNKLWNDISKVVRKQRRNKPFLMVYHPYLPHTKAAIDYWNRNIGNIVPQESAEFVEKSFSNFNSYPRVCEQVRPAIVETFKHCYSEPKLVVYFGSMSMGQILSKRNTPRQKYTRYEHLFECIEKIGPSVAAFGSGVVTTISDSGKTFCVESENEDFPFLTALVIHKIPGLNVKVFDSTGYKGKVDANNCREVLNISKTDNVKGIILFQSMARRSSALTDAIYHYLNKNPHCAMGGGAMCSLECSVNREVKTRGCGLIICGDENVKVSSVGMFQRKMTPKNEAALARVKNMNFEEEDSFAFMFACQGRGGKMHSDFNFESNLFRKYFPKTLLVGAFTGGEYVHEYIPGTDSQPPSSKKSIEYTFSTIFVIVSIARPPASPPP